MSNEYIPWPAGVPFFGTGRKAVRGIGEAEYGSGERVTRMTGPPRHLVLLDIERDQGRVELLLFLHQEAFGPYARVPGLDEAIRYTRLLMSREEYEALPTVRYAVSPEGVVRIKEEI